MTDKQLTKALGQSFRVGRILPAAQALARPARFSRVRPSDGQLR